MGGVNVNTLQNVKELNKYLLDYLNTYYYKKSKNNYLDINKIECDFENSTIFNYTIHIMWGRYYDDEDKQKLLGESHTCEIPIEVSYLENYDFILGKFVSVLDGKNYDTTKKQ